MNNEEATVLEKLKVMTMKREMAKERPVFFEATAEKLGWHRLSAEHYWKNGPPTHRNPAEIRNWIADRHREFGELWTLKREEFSAPDNHGRWWILYEANTGIPYRLKADIARGLADFLRPQFTEIYTL